MNEFDRFPEHISRALEFAERAGLSDRIDFIAGDAEEVLDRVVGPYDLVHDDAWFAVEPPYLEHIIELLRPGGAWTRPNWLLLEYAIGSEPRRDCSEFVGLIGANRRSRTPRVWRTTPGST